MGDLDSTVHANLARWFLHNEGLILEFRYFRIDLAGTRGGLPMSALEVWGTAAEVARVEVPLSVAKGLLAYLTEALPQVNRKRIEEDAKWQADHRS